MSEVVPRVTPSARRFPTSWLVVAAAGVGVAAVLVVAGIRGVPQAGTPVPAPRGAIAPEVWEPVDESLTAGLVSVGGGAEADGIVLTSTGLVATSYSRIMGDSRPPEEGFEVSLPGAGPARVFADEATDIALVSAPGFQPHQIARPGTPARLGDTLTLLDYQGGTLPVLGVAVTVTATDQECSRAGSAARPTGFRFSLDVATAEPGAALVREDGTVVGMYFGGDDARHHCAIPIADVLEAAAAHGR